MSGFWRHERPGRESPDPRAAAAAIRQAIAALEHARPDLAAQLRELAEELERSGREPES